MRIDTSPNSTLIRATLTSPFHHGAGTSGNTSLLRTQDVVQPDGTIARVPFLSAGSIRHGLREALAHHLVEHSGIKPGTLSKTAVDLIFTGGAVTSTGSRTDLDLMRRVEELLPSLRMLGYAARSDITEGTLRASDLILVCEENAWRMPWLKDGGYPIRRAAAYRGTEFSTRHDQATSPAGRYIQTAAGDDGLATAQMIWDTQVLITGAELYGALTLTPAATEMHEVALGAALRLWALDGMAWLGAKTGQGMGQARIDGPDWKQCDKDLEQWTDHIHDHADEIRALIEEMSE